MRAAVVIMSRLPVAGVTKTRLMTKLSGDECAAFHRACLLDIYHHVRNADLPGYLYYTGNTAEIDYQVTRLVQWSQDELWSLLPTEYRNFQIKPQIGHELGERMLHAAEDILSLYEAVILLGSDLPDLSPELLRRAILSLAVSDLVLGPAVDGGYYLLGMKKVHPELFYNIPWGTETVFQRTLEATVKKGLICSMLEIKADIDTWPDLLYFYERGQLSDNQEYQKLNAYKCAKRIVQKYAEGVWP